MSTLRFVTWNICGTSSQAKNIKVMNHLTKLQADLWLMQEIYLTESMSEMKNPTIESYIFNNIQF